MVKSPSEYAWSSYRYFIGKGSKPGWLTTELVLGDLGGEGKVGFRRYREYVDGGKTRELESPLKKAIASTFLGSEEFINNVKAEYLEKRKIDKRNIPAIKKVLRGPTLEGIEKPVAKVLGKDNILCKKMCVYLAHQ